MTTPYRVSVKDSIFEQTRLSREEYDDPTITFDSEAEASAWVEDLNEQLSAPGSVTLHTAHPNDKSDADAYLVFKEGHVWVPDE